VTLSLRDSGIPRLWLGALVALLAAFTYRNMDLLGDSFSYLASGAWVLEHRALPDTDPFAFTSTHAPWILYYPLCQVGFAWLARHAGLHSVLAVSTLVSVAAGLLVVVPHTRSLFARAVGLALLVAFVHVEKDDLSARGQLFGDLGVALLLLLLFRAREGRRVGKGWLLLMGVAWANLHPSFLLGILGPLVAAAVHLLDPPEERPHLRPFVGASLLALIAAGVTPYSYGLLVDVMRLSFDETTRHIDLFQPPDFRSPAWLAVVATAPVILCLRLASGEGRHRSSDIALLVLALGAACSARRFGTLLMSLEVVFVVRRLATVQLPPVAPRVQAGLLAVTGGAAFACAAWLARVPKDPFAQVPRDAVAFVDGAHLPDRVFNPYHWGGYVEYVFGARRKAFIDGRNLLFSNGAFDDAAAIEQGSEQALPLLELYEVRTVIAEVDSPLDHLLSMTPDFVDITRDRLARVYVRR
jgi:hypothetical protein